MKERKINITAVQKRLKDLMPSYKSSLNHTDQFGGEGAFTIIEFDEELLKALLSTEYSAKHLDYDFFMGLIHTIIVQYQILDPKEIALKISEYVDNVSEKLNWICVLPYCFNDPIGWYPFKHKEEKNILNFGKFNLSKSKVEFNDLESELKNNFGISEISQSDYLHHSKQGRGSIKTQPLLFTNLHGSEDSVFNSCKLKFNFFKNLLEVYAVTNGNYGGVWNVNADTPKHVYLVNQESGKILRFPYSSNRINIKPNYFFYESLDSEFTFFTNMIFNRNDKLFTRLKSALNFFSRGLNGKDEVLSFVSYVIAIEAIFSRDKHTPIRITLAEYIALLCYPAEERVVIYNTVKKIYDARSALVHSGKIDIDEKLYREAKSISAKTIVHAFRLYKSLMENENHQIENKFFDHLRDLRLGIKNCDIS